MSESGTQARTAEREPALRRSLGFRDLVVHGLLFTAPMAPVGVFGTLDAKSHGAVALVSVVATDAMAFTAFSYAQMVRVVPRAGSVFAYARAGLGNGGRVRGRPDDDARLRPDPGGRLSVLRGRDSEAMVRRSRRWRGRPPRAGCCSPWDVTGGCRTCCPGRATGCPGGHCCARPW
ncbi:hypothetical protein HDC93_004551 [Streptomyces sp. AK010]|nr:hypothetical protein [Streptomyces sp. AK010]